MPNSAMPTSSSNVVAPTSPHNSFWGSTSALQSIVGYCCITYPPAHSLEGPPCPSCPPYCQKTQQTTGLFCCSHIHSGIMLTIPNSVMLNSSSNVVVKTLGISTLRGPSTPSMYQMTLDHVVDSWGYSALQEHDDYTQFSHIDFILKRRHQHSRHIHSQGALQAPHIAE